MKHILVLALVAAAVGACVSEKAGVSYYQPPSSDGASVRPALVTRNSPEGVPRWEPDLGGWYGIF